jgi:rRNA maturation protein Nop10
VTTELSLYKLQDDLLQLFEMRGDAEREDDNGESLAVMDAAIAEYMEALPQKVDSVRAVWRRIETLIGEAKAEMQFQAQRAKYLQNDLGRLKDYVQRVMELREWPAGKPRKLEGRTGALLLKGNGGRPAVEISDESLIPDELQVVTVQMPWSIWKLTVSRCGDEALSALASCGLKESRAPSLSLIAEQLNRPCKECHNLPMQSCPECGGSGKQSVPGARFAPVGQHVECK